MPVALQLSFRGMDPSPSAENQVRERAAELEQFSDRISMCRVMLEAAHRHHRQGRTYHVRVDLSLPGGHVVAGHDPGKDHAHEDLHVAIRDAFDAARRRLQDHMRRMDGMVKLHDVGDTGRIARIFPDRDFGFLVTETGEEIYLHRNAVPDGGFDALKPGDRVRYVVDPQEGEKGVQASTVVPLGGD